MVKHTQTIRRQQPQGYRCLKFVKLTILYVGCKLCFRTMTKIFRNFFVHDAFGVVANILFVFLIKGH